MPIRMHLSSKLFCCFCPNFSQFEDTYRNLQSAFRLFDFMGDGYVAKVDFRRVLKEFGFDISAVDLDAFLARAGISCVQGE